MMSLMFDVAAAPIDLPATLIAEGASHFAKGVSIFPGIEERLETLLKVPLESWLNTNLGLNLKNLILKTADVPTVMNNWLDTVDVKLSGALMRGYLKTSSYSISETNDWTGVPLIDAHFGMWVEKYSDEQLMSPEYLAYEATRRVLDILYDSLVIYVDQLAEWLPSATEIIVPLISGAGVKIAFTNELDEWEIPDFRLPDVSGDYLTLYILFFGVVIKVPKFPFVDINFFDLVLPNLRLENVVITDYDFYWKDQYDVWKLGSTFIPIKQYKTTHVALDVIAISIFAGIAYFLVSMGLEPLKDAMSKTLTKLPNLNQKSTFEILKSTAQITTKVASIEAEAEEINSKVGATGEETLVDRLVTVLTGINNSLSSINEIIDMIQDVNDGQALSATELEIIKNYLIQIKANIGIKLKL